MNDKQLTFFRVALGAYLAVHFMQLIPWGAELFSNQGALPNGAASPILYLFPNILAVWDSPAMVTGMLVVAVALTMPLMAGHGDRAAALGLYYIWACVFGRNPLIMNPSLPYVGWLLLAGYWNGILGLGGFALFGELRGDPSLTVFLAMGSLFVLAGIGLMVRAVRSTCLRRDSRSARPCRRGRLRGHP